MSFEMTNNKYEGKYLLENVLVPAFSANQLVDKFGIEINTRFKSKYNFFEAGADADITAYTPCPTEYGNVSANQRQGEMCSFDYNFDISDDAFVGTAYEGMLAQGLYQESSAQAVLFDYILETVTKKVQQQWQEILTIGDVDYAGGGYKATCDGLLKKWDNDTEVVDVPDPTVANLKPSTDTTDLSSSVLVELDKLIANLPNSIVGNTAYETTFGVSSAIWSAIDAQYAYGLNFGAGMRGLNQLAPFEYSYRGYNIVKIDSLPDTTMFLTPAKNIKLFLDGSNEFGQLKWVPLSDSFNCDVMRVRMRARSAIDYGFPEQVVYYHE